MDADLEQEHDIKAYTFHIWTVWTPKQKDEKDWQKFIYGMQSLFPHTASVEKIC